MMKYDRLALIFVAFFAVFTANAQDAPGRSREIFWLPPQTVTTGPQKGQFLFFQDAVFDPAHEGLPSYFEQVKLPAGAVAAKAVISNAVFTPLTEAEAALAVNTPNEIVPQVAVGNEKKVPYALVTFVPIRKNSATGKLEKLVSFTLRVDPVAGMRTTTNHRTYTSSSVLSSGTWYKIGVTRTGIHKISYDLLKSLGIDPATLDPGRIRIFGNGGAMLSFRNADARPDDLLENSIWIEGAGDNAFNPNDYILFYGEGPNKWSYSASDQRFHHKVHLYSDTTYYFINIDGADGKRISSQPSLSGGTPVTSFDDYAYHEDDAVSLIKSGREWFGESFNQQANHNFSFTFPNLDAASDGYIKVEVGNRSNTASPYEIKAGSTTSVLTANGYTLCGTCDFVQLANKNFTFTPAGPTVNVSITKQSAAASAWLNYVEVNVRRQLIMSGSQMMFRDKNSVGAGNVAEFILSGTSSPVRVWDVTFPSDAMLQETDVNGSVTQFSAAADTLRQFIAFDGLSFFEPAPFGRVENQNLHALSAADFIIVSHPLFMQHAVKLADMHRDLDTMRVVVVTPQEIFNEFSSGAQDVSAIRDFVKMFYDRASAGDEPRYLLLFGDGSYDNKRRFQSNSNFITTYQSLNSQTPTTSYVSDDFFGLLDDSEGNWGPGDPDMLDIGVGRIPVRTKTEADAVINKIFTYAGLNEKQAAPKDNCSIPVNSTVYGDWRNTVCFVADDEDGSLHLDQAESMARTLDTAHPVLNIDRIYLDAYDQVSSTSGSTYPDATAAMNKRMDKGALIVNYTGHGGELGLSGEGVVSLNTINSWRNVNNLPLWVTATCEFSRFDDPERTSAGEYVLINPEGGGIALLSTVRLVYAAPNFYLNTRFYKHAFKEVNGEMPRLGDLFRLTKTSSGTAVNNRNFTLLGDPALRLAYPKRKVVTTHINEQAVNLSVKDTMKALSVVMVKGIVADINGVKISSYNGILYPTVYDKARTITTLSNDGASPRRSYPLQNSILFKGRAAVTNGEFSYSFVVPKDIVQSYGIGKISYYTSAGRDDGNGYYENIVIGGYDSTAAADATGPAIDLYINDSSFVFGDEVRGTDHEMLAVIKDSTGLNNMRLGIGHDMTAVLDERGNNAIILNDYYQPDLNSHRSGVIRYPFTDLSEGRHTLTVKAWDVHNNSSESFTEFIVAANAKLALKHVLNYPNPFTTRTQFRFEYNQARDMLDVQVQIFTVSGKLIKTIQAWQQGDGKTTEPLEWDGTDDFGDRIGKGVYIYRLRIKNTVGEKAERYERLVILR